MPRTIVLNYARVTRTHISADMTSYTADYVVGHIDANGSRVEYEAAALAGFVTIPMGPTDTVAASFSKLGPAIAAQEMLDFSQSGGDRLLLP